jgi:lysophospholipase L1-like esterase
LESGAGCRKIQGHLVFGQFVRHSILFWALFPFVIPQALVIRKTAPRFAKAEGAPLGLVDVDGSRPLKLLLLGDSIIAGVGARTLDQALAGQTAKVLSQTLARTIAWKAVGKIGVEANGVLQGLIPSTDLHADVVVISVGINDVTSLTSTRRWRANLLGIFKALRAASPKATIVIAGLPPLGLFPLLPQPLRFVLGQRASRLDGILKDLAAQEKVTYVPIQFGMAPDRFAGDGYHPSESSYEEFGRVMGLAAAKQLQNQQSMQS